MSTIELVIVFGLALIGNFASKLFFINDVVALPVICSNGCAGLDIVENEGFQRVPGAVQGDMQTNATHSLFYVSALNGNRYDGFSFGPSTSLARTLTTDEELIDLDAAGQLFTLMTHSATPELLKPGPGGAVTAKAQQFLQVRGTDA